MHQLVTYDVFNEIEEFDTIFSEEEILQILQEEYMGKVEITSVEKVID